MLNIYTDKSLMLWLELCSEGGMAFLQHSLELEMDRTHDILPSILMQSSPEFCTNQVIFESSLIYNAAVSWQNKLHPLCTSLSCDGNFSISEYCTRKYEQYHWMLYISCLSQIASSNNSPHRPTSNQIASSPDAYILGRSVQVWAFSSSHVAYRQAACLAPQIKTNK